MRIAPWYESISSRLLKRMNSGISITTGGTTMSAVLTLSRTSRPKKRIRAIA